jgi:hypothetical protein
MGHCMPVGAAVETLTVLLGKIFWYMEISTVRQVNTLPECRSTPSVCV